MAIPVPDFGAEWNGFRDLMLHDRWPTGDEDGLRSLSEAWQNLQVGVGELQQDGGAAVNSVLSACGGATGPAIAQAWERLSSGPAGLAAVMERAGEAEVATRTAGDYVEHAKANITDALANSIMELYGLAVQEGLAEPHHILAAAGAREIVETGRLRVAEIKDNLVNTMADQRVAEFAGGPAGGVAGGPAGSLAGQEADGTTPPADDDEGPGGDGIPLLPGPFAGAGGLLGAAGAALGGIGSAIAGGAGAVGDKVGSTLDTAGDLARGAVDNVRDMVGDGVRSAGEGVESVLDTVGDVADQAISGAGDRLGEGLERLGDRTGIDELSDASDTVRDTSDQLGDSVDRAADEVGDAASDKVDDLADDIDGTDTGGTGGGDGRGGTGGDGGEGGDGQSGEDDGTSPSRRPAGDLGDLQPIHGTDSAAADRLRGLSNRELIESFNNPRDGEYVLVAEDGRIFNGLHRIAELQRRVAAGEISPDIQVRIDTYEPQLPSEGFWE